MKETSLLKETSLRPTTGPAGLGGRVAGRVGARLGKVLSRVTAALRRVRRRGGRVPFLPQLKTTECGTACLAMILSYHGRETSVAECRELCDAGREGASAHAIARAARAYGLRVRAFSVEPAELRYVRLPAVAHWAFNHFVVVEQWSPRGAVIVDPAEGRRRLTAEEFGAHFTGVVLALEPGLHFRPRHDARKSFWAEYVRRMASVPGVKSVIGQTLLASLLLQGLGLALTGFTKILIDAVLPSRMTNLLYVMPLGIAVVAAAQMLTGYLRSTLLVHLRGRLDSQLMLGFFEHLLALPFRYFQERESGDLMMRVESNNLIREVLTTQTLSIILDAAFVLLYLLILFAQAPGLALAVVGLGLVELLILCASRRRMQSLLQAELAAESGERAFVAEVLKGMPLLKASGSEDRALDHWSNLFFKQLNVSLERGRAQALVEAAMGAAQTLSPLLLLWYGALMVLDGEMSLGTMLALNALGAACLAPLSALVTSGQQLQLVGAHLERTADVLTAEPEQAGRGRRALAEPRLTGRIELRGLHFKYHPDSPEVLRGVSVSIKRGQKVALVGATGCGKSTLAALMLGLYRPTRGEVLYDGVPLHELDYRGLRRQIGVVLQESFLFAGSIRQNITLNDPDVPLGEVVRAAKLACIHDEISAMPMGYETVVAEGGTTLSGGQRQRLSIARALLRNPAVILLDEATSHLDARTERELDLKLSGLPCTRVVIAHRLSTVRNADLILVMSEGRVVEQGTHEDLLARGGDYAALVNGQFRTEPGPAADASARD